MELKNYKICLFFLTAALCGHIVFANYDGTPTPLAYDQFADTGGFDPSMQGYTNFAGTPHDTQLYNYGGNAYQPAAVNAAAANAAASGNDNTFASSQYTDASANSHASALGRDMAMTNSFGSSSIPGLSLENMVPLSSLKHSFNGVAYTYFRPGRCPTVDEAKADVARILQHSKKVRIYCMECTDMVRVLLGYASRGQLSVLLGVWVGDGRQQSEIVKLINILREFPNANINGIVVGNEALYKHRVYEGELLSLLRDTKAKVRGLAAELGCSNLQNVPIFSVEATTTLSPAIIAESDCVGVNIHPFYDGTVQSRNDPDYAHVGQKALLSFITNYQRIKNTYGKPVVVTEVGWPTLSDSSETNIGCFEISEHFMQDFMNYVRGNPIDYYWFEIFDATWKKMMMANAPDDNSEFSWGIYKDDYNTCKPFFVT